MGHTAHAECPSSCRYAVIEAKPCQVKTRFINNWVVRNATCATTTRRESSEFTAEKTRPLREKIDGVLEMMTTQLVGLALSTLFRSSKNTPTDDSVVHLMTVCVR
jgi:hypothetical protein